MGYSIFNHGLLHLVGWKTNGRRRMVLINLQKAFDIINHKILLQKTYSVGFSANQLLGFLVWVVPAYQFSSEYQKWTLQCCKYQRQSSTTFDRVYFTGEVPPLAKNLLIPPPGKILPRRIPPNTTKFLFSVTTKSYITIFS